MSFKFKQNKNFSPAFFNLFLLVVLQITILALGWYNDWWTKKNESNPTQIINAFTEYSQQFKNLDLLPNSADKNIKVQKFAYQLIMGSLSQYQEITATKEWKNLTDFWNDNKLTEITENDPDQKITKLKGIISTFNAFVAEKNYPTLARVSSRMKIRELTSDLKSLEQSLFAYIKDIEFMQATIRTSNLDEMKKTELNSMISEIQNIINSINKDVSSGLQGQATFKILIGSIRNVLKAIKPIITQKSIDNNHAFSGIFYAVIVVFLFSVLMASWLLINERNQKSHMQNVWENNFLVLLNNTFMKGNNSVSPIFSSSFNATFHQIYNYVLKKMQYGQMFQETIPFPTILIDSNLQVRWFNQSLIGEWQLENFIRDRESLSWEHFSQLTNMSANDPVIDVIKNQHAGIFKLQVKPIESDKAVPYQMYVTPYQIAEEKLCLLFFYPLLSLEETIEMQTQSVVSPVRNTLLALIANNYNREYSHSSQSDYDVGSIAELHQLFEDLYQKNLAEQNDLLNQLNEKDIKLQDQHQLVQSLDSNIEQLKRLQVEMKQSIQDLKNYIILSFENIDVVKVNSYELFNNLKNHWEKISSLCQNTEKLITIFHCSKEQAQQVIQLRSTTKEVRDSIQAHRSNSLKVIKAMSAFVDKQNQNRNPLYNTWNSTMSELSKLPDFLTQVDRYIQHCEMILGKVIMKLEDSYKNMDDSIIPQNFSAMPVNISDFISRFDEIENLKDGLINSLKEVYEQMQHQMKIATKSHEHLYYNNVSVDYGQEIGDTN